MRIYGGVLSKHLAATLLFLSVAFHVPVLHTAQTVPALQLNVEPTHLYYPGELPKQGYTFSELLFVNYSASLDNATITIQYYGSTEWWNITSFRGNSVGYTQLYVPVTAYWAHSGENVLRAVTQKSVSNTAVLTITEGSDGYLVDALIYLGLVVAALAAVFFADRLGKKFLVGVFVVYVMLAPFTGHRYDVYFLITSGLRILEHLNPFNPGNPPAYPSALKWAYPPLYTLYSALAFAIYLTITRTGVPSVQSTVYPGYLSAEYSVWRGYVTPTMPLLVFLLKIPMLLSFLAAYVVLSRRIGRRSSLKYWVANPLVFLVCCVWGQLDPIAVALVLFSLSSYLRGKVGSAYLCAALGAAVKLWPAALIPIYFAQRLRLEGTKAFKPLILSVTPILAATLSVYALFGHFAQTLETLLYARSIPTYAGEFSVNGLTWQWILYFLKASPIPLFLFAGPAAMLLISAYAYRHPKADPTALLVLVVLTVFTTYNYVNPQYFLWIVPLLLLQNRRISVWVYTALPLIYVGLSYDVFYFVSPALLYDTYAPSASIAEELKLAFFYNYRPLFIAVSVVAPLIAYVLEARAQVVRLKVEAEAEKHRERLEPHHAPHPL